jgi:leucyl-tRNA synthetase
MSDSPSSSDSPSPAAPPHRYTAALAQEIETTWQDRWDARGVYDAPNPGDPGFDDSKPKLFVLDMFPYPSGAGLHVGHPLGYIATDIATRYARMTGRNVVYTMGFDAFGLPAEQYAVQFGVHPRITTEANVATMKRQLRRLGLGHDRRRAVSTTDVAFYRWTQWIFLQIFNAWFDHERSKARHIDELVEEFALSVRSTPDGRAWSSLTTGEQRAVIDAHRLAYVADAPVNWCPGLGTVVANEEVTADGRSDRGNFPVFKRDMRQWMMRITAYAERLVADLNRLDWPEPIKVMQRNWIGRSTGATVRFSSSAGDIEVFTTRPDTLFGATFMVLSPEHPMVDALTTPEQRASVEAYRAEAAAKSDVDRSDAERTKTGVFLGAHAVNPTSGVEIPVWIADYVLMGYGTGAIMAVPGQDERDWAFAEAYALPIIRTVQPPAEWDGKAYVGDGPAINSGFLDGLAIAEAKAAMIAWLELNGHGEGAITTRLRDWLFSRQRYWGEPFPIVYDEHGPVALPESMLPVELPDTDQFSPRTFDPDDALSEPESPLDRLTEWRDIELDLGDGRRPYRRDTNVMPQWAGSCWYELRYLDPTNDRAFVAPEVERYWMGPQHDGDVGGADLYVGGVEHAVLHLLYSRFWHKVLFDLGHVSSEEPFRRLFNQGYIQADAFTDARGVYVDAAAVVHHDDGTYTHDGEAVSREYGKMGKSLKNAVTPDEMYEAYGADTLRLYEMSMGPLDQSRPWSTRDVVGMQRFLQRLWRLFVDEESGKLVVTDDGPVGDDVRRALHRTIDGVRHDYAHLHFNTAIAKLIELVNTLTKSAASLPRSVAEPLVLMIAPTVPHVAEELWARLGHTESLVDEPFPEADPALLVDDTIEVPVAINGKARSSIVVAADAAAGDLEAAALADPKIAAIVDGRAPKKVIVVPGRMINIVLQAN